MTRGGSDGDAGRKGSTVGGAEAATVAVRIEAEVRRLNPEVRGLSVSMFSPHLHQLDIMLRPLSRSTMERPT
jgi:hypothetical protein